MKKILFSLLCVPLVAMAQVADQTGWQASPEGSTLGTGPSGYDDQDFAEMPKPFGEVMVFLRPDQPLSGSALVELANLEQLKSIPVTIYIMDMSAQQTQRNLPVLELGPVVKDLKQPPALGSIKDIQNQNAAMMNVKAQEYPVLLHITGNERITKYPLMRGGYQQFIQALKRMGYKGR